VLRRLLQLIPTVFFVLTITFILSRVLPGNPAVALLGPKATPENIRKLSEALGLDKPIWFQYLIYLKDLSKLDLGTSYIFRVPVINLLMERLPASLELTVAGVIIATLIGIPLGVLSAKMRNSILDHFTRVSGVIGVSIPVIWIGLVFQIIFGLILGLPVEGRIDPTLKPRSITGSIILDSLLDGNIPGLMSSLEHLLLPAFVLSLPLIGLVMRMVRASMLEILTMDYIRTARMKRLPENVILYKHALKNALIPTITVIGLYFAILVTGEVLTEVIFSWPGIGRLIYEAIMARDYAVIQGTVLFISIIYILTNLAVDILYFYINPQIRGELYGGE